ncbi:PA1136 family autoinducer-binding transcriptional regulator, partial [Serratia marcescens]
HIYWVEGDWFGDGEAVDALTYVRHCPVTRHMLRVSEPFFWTKTRAQQGERYRIVRTPRGAGLHGVQIPVFGPAGLEGAVSLGGERIDASPPVRLALSLVGSAAFQAARRLFAPAAGEGECRLSAREREVLSWTAIGRRQADIAAMLGLSERTVENHLRRIRQRLGAATTAQAIGVAIRLGEIAPERR